MTYRIHKSYLGWERFEEADTPQEAVRQWLDKECDRRDLLDSSFVFRVSNEHSTTEVYAYVSADRCIIVYAASHTYTCSAEGHPKNDVLETSDQSATYEYVSILGRAGCINMGDKLSVHVSSTIGEADFSCQYLGIDEDDDCVVICVKEEL